MQKKVSVLILDLLLFSSIFSGFTFFLIGKTGKIQFWDSLMFFGAGSLASISLHHLSESVVSQNTNFAGGQLLLFCCGFFTFLLLHRLPTALNLYPGKSENTEIGLLLFADALHNFTTSILISSGISGPEYYSKGALAVFLLHEITHKAANFSLLLASGMNRTNALLWQSVAAVPFFSSLILSGTDFHFLRIEDMFAVLSGALLYIAVTMIYGRFKQALNRGKYLQPLSIFLAGVLLPLCLSMFE